MCFVFLGFDTIVMAVLNGRYEWQDRILKARREIRKKIEKSAVWFWLHTHIEISWHCVVTIYARNEI